MEKSRYINVDELQAQTTLEEAAAKCGVTLDAKGHGKEVRIDCPFGCSGDHCGRKEVSINVDNPQRVFQCHAYTCGFRGNLLTLMHGWLSGGKPAGGKLKGSEFQRVRDLLASDRAAILPRNPAASTPTASQSPPPELISNIPLIEAADSKVQDLATINEKLIVDVSSMSPSAASYVRRHTCLTPEALSKWKSGVMPADGGGDKRGWSLRNHVVYPVVSEDGKVLAWIGRDVLYEEKELEFSRFSPAERAEKEAPPKHKFPKGFHRGMELFGQHAARLQEPGYRDLIAICGIIVVEGFNDVIGLDNIGVPAVAMMSNRMTEMQGDKIVRWAKQLAGGRVTLMFDCEPSGIDGTKEALWFFAERQLDVRLAWTPRMHDEAFAERQPESLTREEWETVLLPALARA